MACTSTGITPSYQKSPDFIVLRLLVEESDTQISSDIQFSMSGDWLHTGAQPQPQGVGVSNRSLGDRRTLRSISIETYSSAGSDVGMSSSLTTPTDGGAGLALDKVPFFSGIPSVEVVRGLLHLYKTKAPPGDDVSEMVCALCIPANQDLTAILEALSPVLSMVNKLRVIRDSTPNRYMLLVTFKDKPSASQFYSSFNGQLYNSLEKSVWQLVFVSRVEIYNSSSESSSLCPPGLVELPSCPVCLERLDESVLTILCNHSFHTTCLTRWEYSTCPICRYFQTPEPCEQDNSCFMCDAKEDLWICLICGHIGCGRYIGGHANTHFAQTQHTFSMQLGSNRVWDYIGDNYVHRLVQNKADGKLVEVAGSPGQMGNSEKVDSLQLEYTYLLTSQLESQRLYFEEKLGRVEKDLNEQLSVTEARCRAAVGAKESLEEHLVELEKDKKSLEKKVCQLQTKLNKATTQLTEEKELNKCLGENQSLWKDRVSLLETKMETLASDKEKEMVELRDQIRDLMFYLETQKKIAKSPEDQRQDIQDGHVVVTQGATPSRRQRKKK